MSTNRGMFNPIIWKRGEDYYKKSKVSHITHEGNTFRACVAGSSDYYVDITINKGTIRSMECDCPYALDGHRCKHMAAFIMKLESLGVLGNIEQQDRNKQVNQDNWDAIISHYQTRYGAINHREKIATDKEFAQLLMSKQQDVLKPNTCSASLKSLTQAIAALNKVDDNIEMEQTIATFTIIINELMNSGMKTKGSQWAKKQLNNTKNNAIRTLLIQLAYPLTQEGSAQVMQQLEVLGNAKKYTEMHVYLEHSIAIRKAIGESSEQIIKTLHKYRNFEVVMDYGTAYYMNSQQYHKAEELMNKILENNSISTEKAYEFMLQFETIYEKTKNISKYIEHILLLLKKGTVNSNKNYLGILHGMYENERAWKQDFLILSKKLRQYGKENVIRLYANDKQYEYVLEYIYEGERTLYTLFHYAKELHEYNPQLFYIVLYQKVIDSMKDAKGYYDFFDIYKMLNDIKQYKDYEPFLLEILVYAKENYSRETYFIALLEQID